MFAAPDIDDPIQPTTSNPSIAAAANEPSADQISMVSEMGFTPAQARKALRETVSPTQSSDFPACARAEHTFMQGGSAEAAIDWLFSHPDDQGDDGTAAASSSDAVGTTSSATDKARGSKDLPAQYKLKAFISHKGKHM